MLCEYGCGQEATHQFKNGKWCCKNHQSKCEKIKEIRNYKLLTNEQKKSISRKLKGRVFSEEHKEKLKISRQKQIIKSPCKETRKKLSESLKGRKFTSDHINKLKEAATGRILDEETRQKISKTERYKLKDYQEKYPFSCQVEELREDPETGEIQGHCKYHECPNSKENNGWFTLLPGQLQYRIYSLEHPNGNDGHYLYCSEECKQKCILHGLNPINFINNLKLSNQVYYTNEEYQTYREEVLKRANYKCEYCGEKAEHIHHSRPQKLEPFFSLDPDYGISCCQKCHYEKGHKDECSTGQIAQKVCL